MPILYKDISKYDLVYNFASSENNLYWYINYNLLKDAIRDIFLN